MTIKDTHNNEFFNKFEYNIKGAVQALKDEFGQQFSVSQSVREQHTSTDYDNPIVDICHFFSSANCRKSQTKFIVTFNKAYKAKIVWTS